MLAAVAVAPVAVATPAAPAAVGPAGLTGPAGPVAAAVDAAGERNARVHVVFPRKNHGKNGNHWKMIRKPSETIGKSQENHKKTMGKG